MMRKSYLENRRIVTGAAGLLVAKLVSMLALILTVPLALKHLGAEQFGVWMTLTSLSSILSAADFGVGNGIMTELAKNSRDEDGSKLSSVVTNGFITLLSLSILMTAMFLILLPWINPEYIFGYLSASGRSSARLAMVVFFIASFISIPAMLGQRMMLGLQLGWWSGIWAGVGSLTSLIALLIVISMNAGLPGMMLAFVGSPAAILIIATFWTFIKRRDVRICINLIDIKEVRRLASQGARYFMLTVVYALSFTTDNLIISHFMGAKFVALYSISDRLFQIIAVALTMISAPLWPAYADAYAQRRYGWVITTFRRSIIFNVVIGGAGASVLIAMSHVVFPLWIGGAIIPPLSLMFWIAGRRILEAVYTACNNLMNALDVIGVQLFFGGLMAFASVMLRIVFVKNFGVNGVPMAVIVGVALFGFVPTFVAIRRLRMLMSKIK